MTRDIGAEGLRRVLNGLIGLVIASALTGIAGISTVGLSPFSISIKINISSNIYSPQFQPHITTYFSGTGSLIILIAGILKVVGGLLFLVFALAYIVPGFRLALQPMRSIYETRLKLLTIGLPIIGVAETLYGIATACLSRTLHTFFSALSQLIGAVWILGVFTAIALIGRLIGYIGLGWLNLDLYNRFKEEFLLAAAILFFVAIPFNIVGFIAWILELVAVHQLLARQTLSHTASITPAG